MTVENFNLKYPCYRNILGKTEKAFHNKHDDKIEEAIVKQFHKNAKMGVWLCHEASDACTGVGMVLISSDSIRNGQTESTLAQEPLFEPPKFVKMKQRKKISF